LAWNPRTSSPIGRGEEKAPCEECNLKVVLSQGSSGLIEEERAPHDDVKSASWKKVLAQGSSHVRRGEK
jgi:hypothetical protein